jgi:hypothetical protein
MAAPATMATITASPGKPRNCRSPVPGRSRRDCAPTGIVGARSAGDVLVPAAIAQRLRSHGCCGSPLRGRLSSAGNRAGTALPHCGSPLAHATFSGRCAAIHLVCGRCFGARSNSPSLRAIARGLKLNPSDVAFAGLPDDHRAPFRTSGIQPCPDHTPCGKAATRKQI